MFKLYFAIENKARSAKRSIQDHPEAAMLSVIFGSLVATAVVHSIVMDERGSTKE